MKRISLVVAVGIGLGIGLGGGTAAVAVREQPAIPADSLAVADSLAERTDSASVADSAGVHASSDSVRHAAATDGSVPAIDSREVAAAERTGAPIPGIPELAAADELPRAGIDSTRARLSRIFGAMEAEAAADVLKQLGDGQVEAVLLGLSDRRAAAILGNFPSERAAALTASMLTKGR